MPVDLEKKKARWRRNKASERKRNSEFPREVAPELIAAILAERDRRISETSIIGSVWRDSFFFQTSVLEKALTFAADVWAADLILVEQWGPNGAKPSRVAEWLKEHGHDHGYSDLSLPKMIRKARLRIIALQTNDDGFRNLIWPPFP